MQRITAIKPTSHDAQRFTVRAGGEVVATLAESSVRALGLWVGMAWTGDLAERVRAAALNDKVRRDAMRLLNRRPLGRGMLIERLIGRGYPRKDIDDVVEDLAWRGLVDDQAFARLVIRAELGRKPAGRRLLRHKLMQKKLAPELIDRLLDEELGERDPVSEARALAERRMATAAMQRLDPRKRQQRLWNLLARRGFELETIRDAMNGLLDEPD
jgi:regulatory protein